MVKAKIVGQVELPPAAPPKKKWERRATDVQKEIFFRNNPMAQTMYEGGALTEEALYKAVQKEIHGK